MGLIVYWYTPIFQDAFLSVRADRAVGPILSATIMYFQFQVPAEKKKIWGARLCPDSHRVEEGLNG
jgi:hypothetical protein